MKPLESARFNRMMMTSLWILLGAALLIMLLTYAPSDSSWTHINSNSSSYSNVFGNTGAWIADVLMAFFGHAAILLPVFILLEAIQVWWPFSFVGNVYRWVGQFFIVITVSILLSLHLLQPTDALSNASGGILGYEFATTLLALTNFKIITVILVLAIIMLSTLCFGIYWHKIFDIVGRIPNLLASLFYKNSPLDAQLATAHYYDNVQQNTPSNTTDDNFDYTTSLARSLAREQAKAAQVLAAVETALTINNSHTLEPLIDNNTDVISRVKPDSTTVQKIIETPHTSSPLVDDDIFDTFLNSMRGAESSPITEPKIETTTTLEASPIIASSTIDSPIIAGPTETLPTNDEDRDDTFDRAIAAFEQLNHTQPLVNNDPIVPDQKPTSEPHPATSASPASRSMQVVQHRAGLSPLPSLDLLEQPDPNSKVSFSKEQLERLSKLLEIKLKEFNVVAEVKDAQPGPVVTRFELELAAGIKASKVTGIARDLARSLSMASVRVVEIIPGKPYIGIEIPNAKREMVRLTELLQTPAYRDPKALISMAMGKDIAGRPVLTDLAKAPHMLVAGTTGSGKSVAVNAMLLSMLLKYTPSQLRLILIDPKQLELSNYNDIPHLLTPVVTDMKDATNALNWCVGEMERRYKLLAFLKVRNLEGYNDKVKRANETGEDLIDPLWKPEDTALQQTAPRLRSLPVIVVVADEFADMIMQVGKKAEDLIQRIAQKARAAGIHLILATQRPSVDVITGLIKANIPTRVALRVNSKIDSRTILDEGGAEYLLGHGDMLFLAPGKNEPERVHGAFISDDEVNKICDAWRERGSPDYVDDILTPYDEDGAKGGGYGGEEGDSERDVMYDQCVAFILETRKVSASSLQRKFSLGYNRAARIIDTMEAAGVISSATGPSGKRELLV